MTRTTLGPRSRGTVQRGCSTNCTSTIVRAYFLETQAMVSSAQDKAFASFSEVRWRGIRRSMKTVVEKVFVGRAREYNRRTTM